MMSWIERSDWVRAVEKLLRTPLVNGPVNLVAPTPVSNAEFSATLGRVLGKPAALTVPEFAIRLALGEMGEEVLLAGQRVVPTRLLGTGFSFAYETIDAALRAVLPA
jgi:NAD dependent epimerase/dehydratase family enzyme